MSDPTQTHDGKAQSADQPLTKAQIRAAKKEAKAQLKEQAKNDKLEAKKAKLEAKQAKSADKVKRYKRSYAHEKDVVKGNPEVKAALLFVFILAVILGAFYGRVFLLNPQLDENRRNIAQIPQLNQVYDASLLQTRRLKSQVQALKASVDSLKSATASLSSVEPQVTEYLYILQRFQIKCENYKLEKQPLSDGPEGEGLVKVSVSYRCNGPFLSYLQAMTQLQKLDALVNIEQERIYKSENSELVAIEGQMTFVVNNYD
jgi:hypothetical protein